MQAGRRLFRPGILRKHAVTTKSVSFATSRILRNPQHEHEQDFGSQQAKSHNGNKPRPQRASIRPLTVLLICIPIGYGIRWLLQNENTSTSTKSADGFVKYTLTAKQPVSSTSSIFTLKPATSTIIRTNDPGLKRAITSVQFKQPQLQIARNYTLLPTTPDQTPDELRFLIREEKKGEVSAYLHRLPVGAEVEVRGLSVEYVLPEKVDTVLFLAGGTGIVPAMQVAHTLAGKADVHVLWANRRREDCPGGKSDTIKKSVGSWDWSGWWSPFGLPSTAVTGEKRADGLGAKTKGAIVLQLESLKRLVETEATTDSNSKSLIVDYYVDEEGTFINPKDISRLVHRSSLDPKRSSSSPKKLLLVSGPEGFITHWAGSKQWVNGREIQGPLGGALSKIDLRDWEVIKL